MIHLLWLSLSIPIIIHLVYRRRAKPMPFSTLYFLRMVDQRVQRNYRLKEILLLLLRLALLAAVVGALEAPILRSKTFKGSSVPTAVAIVLDNTYSMQAIQQGQAVFERARAAAIEVMGGLSGQDAVVVVPVVSPDTTPEPPTTAISKLKSQITQMECSYGTGELAAPLKRALESLKLSKNQRKELYIITDMQKLSWTPALEEIHLPKEVPTFVVDVGTDVTQNLAITNADFGLKVCVKGTVSNLYCDLANTGTRNMSRNVAFYLRNDRIKEQEVTVPAGGTKTVIFSHVFDEVAYFNGYVELDPDNIIVDNRRYFTVSVHDKIQALLVNGMPSSIPYRDGVFYLKLALGAATAEGRSLSPIQPKVVTEPEVLSEQLSDYACVVLANVPRIDQRLAERLDLYVRNGGGLVIFCGDLVDIESYNTTLGGTTITAPVFGREGEEKEVTEVKATEMPGLLPAKLGPLKTAIGGDADAEFPIQAINEKHPIFRDIIKVIGEDVQKRTQIRKMLSVLDIEKETQHTTSVIVNTAGGPLLLEKKVGTGTVILCTTTCTPEWNNMPARSYFLPFMHQLIYYVSQSASVRPSVPVGMSYTYKILDSTEPMQVRFYAPATDEEAEKTEAPADIVKSVIHQGENRATFNKTSKPGIYRVEVGAGDNVHRHYFAVNVDAKESDVQRLPPEEARAKLKGEAPITIVEQPDKLGAVVGRHREGLPLWDYLLLIAIIVAVCETYVANVVVKHSS
jgi:hypothetical protein